MLPNRPVSRLFALSAASLALFAAQLTAIGQSPPSKDGRSGDSAKGSPVYRSPWFRPGEVIRQVGQRSVDDVPVRVERIPARVPGQAALNATYRQNERYRGQQQTIANIQVSRSGTAKGARRPVTDFSEVHLAVDPTDSRHFLGGSKFFHNPQSYQFYTGVFESMDGGRTWTQEQPDGVETYSLTSDPVMMFDGLGNGYFTLLTRAPTGLDLLTKPKNGAWQRPIVVDRSTVTDKQWIIADQDPLRQSPHAGNLYMSWTSVQAGQIVFSRSVDTNKTWSAPPVRLGQGNVQGSTPAVAPDGTVYVVWGENIFSGPASGYLALVKSTDGGKTFDAPRRVVSITSIPFQLTNGRFRTPASLPAFAASPVDGNLYLSWADYRLGDADIYLSRSVDAGMTWSTPQRVNDDPAANGIDQIQPQIAVAPNGRVAVAWVDRRLDCPDQPWIARQRVGLINACLDTFMARSVDEGLTWQPNIRASTQTWDPEVHVPHVNADVTFIGDYIGLASTSDMDFPFWPATADLGDNPDNSQEAFVALIPEDFSYPTPTAGPSPTPRPTVTPPPSTPTRTATPTRAGPTPRPSATREPDPAIYVPNALQSRSGANAHR